MSDDKKMLNEFPQVTTAEWEAKIQADLKGADYDKKLVWKTMEGFAVRPYYRAENLELLEYLNQVPGEYPFVRGGKADRNEWYIRQDIVVKNEADANRKALEILQKGVTSLGFVFGKDISFSPATLENLLKGICLSAIEINFVCGKRAPELVPLFVDYVRKNGYKADEITGSVSFDNLGHLAKKGKFYFDDNQKAVEAYTSIINLLKPFPGFRPVLIHGSYFTNAGSSVVQSLAFSLAMGADYLSWLTDAGISAAEAANALKFNFAVSSDYFMEIARFRAARFLWAKIVSCFDENCKTVMNIHAETSRWNKTAYDPNVNMLRSTTEAMSAALGMVNSLTVVPFDVTYEQPTDFAERVGRNTQIILQEEAYLNKIVDPSAGSYYIENLTDAIVTESWKLFLEVQNKGGFVQAFKEGFVQAQVKDVASKRMKAIATRRETLLGTNQFPNFNEILDGEICDVSYSYCHDPKNCKEGKNTDCCSDNRIAEPLHLFRGAEAFEDLRRKTDRSGHRPSVFMLTMGNVAMRKARAAFACNFFACAGFEVKDNNGFKTVDEGLQEALRQKADIVVICSSDDDYAVLAPEAFEKLDGKAVFVVAGEPACKAELEAKGIHNFISVKSNLLDSLTDYQKKLNII